MRGAEPVLLGDKLLGDRRAEPVIGVSDTEIGPVPGRAGGIDGVRILRARHARHTDGPSDFLTIPQQAEIDEAVHVGPGTQIGDVIDFRVKAAARIHRDVLIQADDLGREVGGVVLRYPSGRVIRLQ